MSKWIVKIGGYEYEAELDQIKQWIHEGRVLPEDMILRKGLGWKAAMEIPALKEAFEEQSKRPPSKKEQPEEPPVHYYTQHNQGYGESLSLPTLKQRSTGYSVDMFSYSLFLLPGWLLGRLKEAEGIMKGLSSDEVASSAASNFLALLGLVVGVALNVYLTSNYGGSIGKKVTGTVILDNKTKSFLSYEKATVREIIRGLIIFPVFQEKILIFLWIICAWLVLDSNRQQLYDKIINANVYDDASN